MCKSVPNVVYLLNSDVFVTNLKWYYMIVFFSYHHYYLSQNKE